MYKLTQLIFILSHFALTAHASNLILAEKIDIAEVWAAHPVNFAIVTEDDFQCVAYYDTTRRMVVASRTVGSDEWQHTKLNTTTGWDSHNYIAMTIDDSGYIHISGNMHNASSLIYFRSDAPYDISSFSSPGMVGYQEGSITYPVFIKGGENQLIFQYRDGGSGSGTTIWNGYDITTKKWTRLTSKGLLDGEGQVNAYQTSPVAGPDGFFHIIWMWRDTPVANTNHHLSHIKSRDLTTWKTMAGDVLNMPVKQSTRGVIVDPVGSGHGLINMDFWISWDTQNRAVISYHRYDNNNISQIYNTRWEEDHWQIYQTSDWHSFTWDLDRQGSLSHDIAATPLDINENGDLIQNYVYRDNDVRQWVLDESTLSPTTDGIYEPPEVIEELYEVESDFPQMQVNRIRDGEFYLRWETLPINQDQPRSNYPSSSMLRLYRYTKATALRRDRFHAAHSNFSLAKNRHHIIISRTVKPVSSSSQLKAALFSIDGKCHILQPFGTSGCCIIPTGAIVRGIYILQVIDTLSDGSSVLFSERLTVH